MCNILLLIREWRLGGGSVTTFHGGIRELNRANGVRTNENDIPARNDKTDGDGVCKSSRTRNLKDSNCDGSG